MTVSGLAPEVDDATLAEAFSSAGDVVAASVYRDLATKQRRALLTTRPRAGARRSDQLRPPR